MWGRQRGERPFVLISNYNVDDVFPSLSPHTPLCCIQNGSTSLSDDYMAYITERDICKVDFNTPHRGIMLKTHPRNAGNKMLRGVVYLFLS